MIPVIELARTRLESRRREIEAQDPARLARRLGLTLDDWQRDVLRSTSLRVALLCCRQSGKSTTVAMLAVHTAVYKPGSLILVLSPSLRQSIETFRKCLDAYGVLAGDAPADSETLMRLELENGSRIISLPGAEKNVRGFSSVDLLLVDEAARCDDPLYFSIRPMLAVSGGRIIALTTPAGNLGWFYKVWTEGEGWERHMITAEMCPRITPEFLAEERRAMPNEIFRAEYNCEFLDPEGSVFSEEDIQAMLDESVPLKGWWNTPHAEADHSDKVDVFDR